MKKEDIIRKLTSRKFWAAVAAFVTALIVTFKGDAETAETITGLIMAGATVIAYILGEGFVDAKNNCENENGITDILNANTALIAALLADNDCEEEHKENTDKTDCDVAAE